MRIRVTMYIDGIENEESVRVLTKKQLKDLVCLAQKADMKLGDEAIGKIHNALSHDAKKTDSQFHELVWDDEFWAALEFHENAEDIEPD